MRRGLLLAGVWALGVVASVTLAFAAVGRVASGVAPHDGTRLSQTAIDDQLTSRATLPSATSTSSTTRSSSSTTSPTTVTTPTTRPTSPNVTSPPPTSNTSPPTVTTVWAAPPNVPVNTVTTSQGGTLFTRCSGPDTIAYVAAVPRTGYQRTLDIEDPTGIEQVFANARDQSKIDASCSNGIVHAHVEEESADN